MKKSGRRCVAGLMAVLTALSISACSSPSQAPSSGGGSQPDASGGAKAYYNKTGLPICSQKITITMAGVDASGDFGGNKSSKWEDTLMAQDWEKRFGISIKTDTYNADDWSTQLPLLISGGELPDLLVNAGMTEATAQKYGKQGYFADLSQYKDLAPNLYAVFNEHPEYKAFLSDEKGGIYGLSGLSAFEHDALNRVYMMKSWLSKVNMPAPTTVDELYQVLKAFKANDANGNGKDDEIPMTWTANGDEMMLLEAFGINVKDPTWLMEVGDGGKVSFAGSTDNYKAFLKYVHKLYAEGLLDKTNFTATYDEKAAEVQKGIVGTVDTVPFALRNADISTDADWVWIGGLTSEVNDKQYVAIADGVNSSVAVAVNGDSKYKEAIVRLIDYYYSEEGYPEGMSGPLNVAWKYVDDPILGCKIREFIRPSDYSSDEEFRVKKATINGAFSLYGKLDYIGRANLYQLDDKALSSDAVIKKYGWGALTETGMRRKGNQMVYSKDMYPVMSYTEEESTELATLKTGLQNYMKNIRTQFIVGEEDIDKGWDNYINQLDQMGLKRLLQIEQAAYDRFQKNLNQ